MISFVEYKDIDKRKWDDCITQSINPIIFVYSWYLDAVCEKWSGLILNDYEAVFPLAEKSKYRISYLYQPFFTRYFDVFSKKKISANLRTSFFASIPNKYKYIDICLHESNSDVSSGFEITTRKYQLLELNQSYETIYKSYSDNTKRNVKKALKAELKVSNDINPEKIVALFKSTKGEELEVFNTEDYERLVKLMNALIQKNKAYTLAVRDKQDNLIAAAFFMRDGNRFTYLKSGVTNIGRTTGAMHLLFDFFIKKHSGTDTFLDFGGSSVESVARFYKSFGAKDCVYLQLKKNNLSGLAKWLSNKK